MPNLPAKYWMRYHEIINEDVRDAPLYHHMDFAKAWDVLNTDTMPARWDHIIPGMGEQHGISMSHNAALGYHTRPICLVFDKAKLATKHKIVPLDGERVFRSTIRNKEDVTPERGEYIPTGRGDREMNAKFGGLAEEFVIGSITGLHHYLRRIIIKSPNFYHLSGQNALDLDILVKSYCTKNGIELTVDPEWESNLADIREMRGFEDEDDLEEAAPSNAMRDKMFYHGTSKTEAAKAILKNGLVPPEITRKGQLVPVKGRVYITDQLRYAIIYALGGDYLGHDPRPSMTETDPYGYVFEVDGSELRDVQPDEDSVGEFMSDVYRKLKEEGKAPRFSQSASLYGDEEQKVFTAIWNAMTETQRRNGAQNYLYAAWAAGGKRAVKYMPDWMKVWLIDHSMAHVAHGGNIPAKGCWRFDRRKSKQLAKDGSNFFQLAKRIK
jgi:hypothetical protein